MMENVVCPKCTSSNVIFSKKRKIQVCEDCDHEFTLTKPASALRIFLSYGHDGYTPQAVRIKQDLESRGHTVWYDAERLREGRDWEQYIEQGLNACDKVVLLMTPYSVRRRIPGDAESSEGYCLNEIAKALERNKLIIPVLLAFVDQGPPVSICRIQYLDLRDVVPIGDHEQSYVPRFERLIRAIENDELNFEGGQARLQRLLRPIDFDLQISRQLSHFRGREWLVEQLNEWLKEPGESRVFWLVGPPGVGKSAFAASLRHRGDVGAFHFCVHGNDDKSDPRRAVLSLAYQLSQQLPEYERRLQLLALEEDVAKNAATLFETIIVGPLTKEFPAPKHDMLIVIDGIDEATRDGRNEIADFVALHWPQTPHWLKLVLTSRAEEVIKTPLKRLSLQPKIISADSPLNRQDIADYCAAELAKAGQQVSRDVIAQLVERTEGIFLFAQVLVREIVDGHLSLSNPADLPAGLGDYYRRFFNRQFADHGRYEAEVAPLLSIVAAQREPLSMSILARAAGISVFQARRRLGWLGTLLVIRGNGDEHDTVAPFHKSLMEWLGEVDAESGSYAAGPFAVSIEEGHQLLARFCHQEYRNGGIDANPYVLRYILAHLRSAGEWSALEAMLQDRDFCQVRIAESGLAVVAAEWSEAALCCLQSPGCAATSRVTKAALFAAPLLPQLIDALESNTTGVSGPVAPESVPVGRIVECLPDAEVAELFRNAASLLTPTLNITEQPEIRAAMCATQMFAEIGDVRREMGVARELVRIYPTAFKVLHFAAIAARHLAMVDSDHREDHFNEALSLEKRAQALPEAERDGYYALTFSTTGKIQLGLARHYRATDRDNLAGPLLEEALANIALRLRSGQTPVALTYYAQVLEELGRDEEAYTLARGICEQCDSFIDDAQAIILRLADTEPWLHRYDPPVWRHARHWIVTQTVSSESDRNDAATRMQMLDEYFRFLLAQGLEPEIALRFAGDPLLLGTDMEERCNSAARPVRAIAVRIGGAVLECDVQVWEFEQPQPHVVVGLPTIGIFGSGETIQIALEYLRALLVILEVAITTGRWVTWRPGNVQLVARWVENHRRRGTSPPPRVAELLGEAERVYFHGELEQALPLLNDLEAMRELFDLHQLHDYLRKRAWIAGRRGEVDCLRGLEQLSRLNSTSHAFLTDYVSTLVTSQYIPDARIDPWLELGQAVFHDANSNSGWRTHFLEHFGAVQIARGEAAIAVELLREALQKEREGLNDQRIATRIQSRLGEALRQLGQLQEAHELLTASRQIQVEHHFQLDLIDLTLPSLARLHPELADSVGLLVEAQQIARKVGALKALGRLMLLEARMTTDVARSDEIRSMVTSMQPDLPVLNEAPIPRILGNWNAWRCSAPSAKDDYWGL